MVLSTTKMTAEQYLQLGEHPPGVRLELVEGEIAVSPSPSLEHSFTQLRLSAVLVNHVKSLGSGELIGEVDTLLDQFNVRRPDILFFSKTRTRVIGKRPILEPPDLAVEIVSPTSIKIDRSDKFAQYRDAGVAHYWIVDPIAHTIEAFRLESGEYAPSGNGQNDDVVQLPPFLDLSISLADLWRK
jgi:Uma2 family endonuclease